MRKAPVEEKRGGGGVAAEFVEEERQRLRAKQNAEKKSETKRLQIPSEKQE